MRLSMVSLITTFSFRGLFHYRKEKLSLLASSVVLVASRVDKYLLSIYTSLFYYTIVIINHLFKSIYHEVPNQTQVYLCMTRFNFNHHHYCFSSYLGNSIHPYYITLEKIANKTTHRSYLLYTIDHHSCMRVVMGHYLFCSTVYILFITARRNGQITTRVTEYYWVVRPFPLK